MKLITVAGPPSSGKTAVLAHTIRRLLADGQRVVAGKIDCVETSDGRIYESLGIPVTVGLSADLCPDHYYVANLEEIFSWAKVHNAAIAIIETAGLCHRCAPAITGCLAIAVVDNLSGIDTPAKIGPVLLTADVIVITKGDIVSQAEREVFRQRVRSVNHAAKILEVNGLTGRGAVQLARCISAAEEVASLADKNLRSSMPAGICSYCTGETRIGGAFQLGHLHKIAVPGANRQGE
jgi:Ni2+-binding GTPase involved in maturation of urease and hydrogenase